jgi:putative addiction module killer protein
MKISIKEYIQENGVSPYQRWFDGLDPLAAAKVATAQRRMGMGNLSNVKWFDGIGECRINWGPGYRIYLAKEGESLVILFGGGTKRHQAKDIRQAKALFNEYKARKKASKKIER